MDNEVMKAIGKSLEYQGSILILIANQLESSDPTASNAVTGVYEALMNIAAELPC